MSARPWRAELDGLDIAPPVPQCVRLFVRPDGIDLRVSEMSLRLGGGFVTIAVPLDLAAARHLRGVLDREIARLVRMIGGPETDAA